MTDTIAELRELMGKATAGPWDHMEGMGIVRALRGDVAIPLFETRTPWGDQHHGAPTVRLGGEVVFRANSEGARTSEALSREWNNAALVAAALNALAALLDRVEAGDKAVALMRAYYTAEGERNDCEECDNEGPWEHCGPCSERIGEAINDQLLFLAEVNGAPHIPQAPADIEDIARAIHESDPDVGCTWAEWVAYAQAHPDHMQAVDHVRRQACAVAALQQKADTP